MRSLIMLFFYFSSCSLLFANSGYGGVDAGGLKLQQTQDIAMISEKLYISMDKIEIDYIFENLTDNDITATVLFPVAPYELDAEYDQNIPSGKDGRILDFHVFADGREIATKMVREVIAADDETNETCSTADQCRFVKVTYHWQQYFPARKKIHLHQSYIPGPSGEIGGSPVGVVDEMRDDGHEKETYCLDEDFFTTLNRRETRDGYGYVRFVYLKYILTTAQSWAGGRIGDFTLIIDKGKVKNLVSFCGDNVKKISPTRFEMHKINYLPMNELDILFMAGFSNL